MILSTSSALIIRLFRQLEPILGATAVMDHLPVVEDAAFPPDEVICTVSNSWQYDGSGLTRFPLQIGFFFDKGRGKYSRKNDVLNTEKEKIVQSPAEKIAFIQSWLFFWCLDRGLCNSGNTL